MAHNSSEKKKDFLLKSLDDLDSELAKGDITEKDYANYLETTNEDLLS